IGGEWHLKFTFRLKEGRPRMSVGLSVSVKVDLFGLRKFKNQFTLYFYRILIMPAGARFDSYRMQIRKGQPQPNTVPITAPSTPIVSRSFHRRWIEASPAYFCRK